MVQPIKKQVKIDGKLYSLATVYNNPGNIEDTEGYAGTIGRYAMEREKIRTRLAANREGILEEQTTLAGRTGFAHFDHKVSGLRALAVDINAKLNKPNMTLDLLVHKYAPPRDNVGTLENYKKFVLNTVAEKTDLSIETLLQPNFIETAGVGRDVVIKAIMRGKTNFENANIAFYDTKQNKAVRAKDYYDDASIDEAVLLSKNTDYSKNTSYEQMKESLSDKVKNQVDNSKYPQDTLDITAADFGFKENV
mgnify:CR=1 FL=1